MMFGRRFSCPCCGLPTLAERSVWEICVVCWWEDDGQGDERADEVWGGPNSKYSLTAARANFRSHGHMYDKGEGIDVVERPSPERAALLSYAKAVIGGTERLDNARLEKLIRADKLVREREP